MYIIWLSRFLALSSWRTGTAPFHLTGTYGKGLQVDGFFMNSTFLPQSILILIFHGTCFPLFLTLYNNPFIYCMIRLKTVKPGQCLCHVLAIFLLLTSSPSNKSTIPTVLIGQWFSSLIKHLQVLIEHGLLVPTSRVSDLVCLGWGLRICIFDKLRGDANGPRAILWFEQNLSPNVVAVLSLSCTLESPGKFLVHIDTRPIPHRFRFILWGWGPAMFVIFLKSVMCSQP